MNSTSVVHQTIRRSNITFLLFGLALLLLLGVGLIRSDKHLYNFFNGPFDMSGEELLSITDLSSLDEFYVNLIGEDAFEVKGIVDHYGEPDSSYAVLQFENRLLLVIAPEVKDKDTRIRYTGQLETISGHLQSTLIQPIIHQYPEWEGRFLPYLFRTGTFVGIMMMGFALGGIMLLGGLYALFISIRRSTNHSRHPIMRRLRYAGHSDESVSQIDYEIQQSDHDQVTKRMHFTRNWFLMITKTNIYPIYYADVVWAYDSIIGYGGAVVYFIVIKSRSGKVNRILCSQREFYVTIQAIQQHMPWVYLGYNNRLKQRWKTEREQMITEVEERRKEYRAQTVS